MASATTGSYILEYEAEVECQSVNTLRGTSQIVGVCKEVGQIFRSSGPDTVSENRKWLESPDGKIYRG